MKIIFIGFMGAGKSTVAKLVSGILAWRFIELDDLILQNSGFSSISEIFELKGESHFRQLENTLCKSLAAEEKCVISCGGGVVENPENITILKSTGDIIVFLSATFDVIQARLSGDTSRPLFQNIERAKELFEKRLNKYTAVADLIVETSSLSPDQIAGEVIGKLPLKEGYAKK